MLKVKLLNRSDTLHLDEVINSFIEDNKYTLVSVQAFNKYEALVVYEDNSNILPLRPTRKPLNG